MLINEFATIDAQDEIGTLTRMTPEETAEFEKWLDESAERFIRLHGDDDLPF